MPVTYIRQTDIVLDPAKVENVRQRLQFGPEIECGTPFHPAAGRGYGHSGSGLKPLSFNGCTQDMTDLMFVGTDSSLSTHLAYTAEIKPRTVIPMSKMKVLIDLIKVMNDLGARVNQSCGFHIHVSLKDMNRSFPVVGRQEEKRILLRTMALAHRFSAVYHAVAGRRTRWRETSNPIGNVRISPIAPRIATPVLRDEDQNLYEAPAIPQGTTLYSMNDIVSSFVDGRRGIHFTNWKESNKGLYEVRAYSGTMKPVKVLGYMGMAGAILHLAAAATDDSGCTISPPEDIINDTSINFEQRLEEFFTVFGWTDDGPKLGLPDLSGQDYTLTQVKEELLRLARKTDTKSAVGEEESETEDRSARTQRTPETARPTDAPAPPAAPNMSDFYRELPASSVLAAIPSNPDELTPEILDGIFAEFDRLVALPVT